LAIILLPIVIFLFINFNIFIQAKSNNVPISLLDLLFFKLRKIDPDLMLNSVVRLHKSNILVDIETIQCHILSGGDIQSVVEASISASRSKLPFGFDDLCKIDLAGRDVTQAVESYVNPVTIHCPGRESGQKYMVGITDDGIRLGVQVRVTVRADMNKIVGGAGEQTVKARVGEGVISVLGGEKSHKTILEHPELISKRIQNSGLLAGTAYELVSVDVLEIEVLDNIGAHLQSEQSTADKLTAEAKAEAKKAEAIAISQEMKARKKDMLSQVILSKSSLPSAMASAFNEGNIGQKGCPVRKVFIK